MTLKWTAPSILCILLMTPVASFALPPPDDQDSTATGGATQPEAEPPAAAPQPDDSTGLRSLVRDLARDFKHLPSRDSLLVASIGGGLALSVHPLDPDVNQRLANDGGFFKAGAVIGNTATLMGVSAAAYGLGLATGHSRVAHVGLDLLRAQILTEAMVQSLKFTVERPRPDGSSGYAFPSGHAAVTFATATVIQRHHGFLWALPTYAVATYVATARLHDNVHNLSDVVFGAAVGTIAGRTVTRHGHSNFALVPAAIPGGAALIVVRTSTP